MQGGKLMERDWIIENFGYTLQEVAEIINRMGLRTTHQDTRCTKIEFGTINYYGENILLVHGLPHKCIIAQRSMFIDRHPTFFFKYEGEYFKNMYVESIISVLKNELKKVHISSK